MCRSMFARAGYDDKYEIDWLVNTSWGLWVGTPHGGPWGWVIIGFVDFDERHSKFDFPERVGRHRSDRCR